MALREKYNHAIQTAKNFGMEGSAEERNGKLYFTGTVKNQDEANRIWDAIKTVPDWRTDIVGEINVSQTTAAAAGAGAGSATTYTVKPGDTLSKIAKEHLGDGNAFNAILEANRDQLDDADKIKPGQVLKIPART